MATPVEQLEAMRSLEENWDGYGAAAPQVNLIELAQEFTLLIEAIFHNSATGPFALHVSPTRVGGIIIDWEDQLRQHEIEINPDGSIGFLHAHKASGQIESRKFTPTAHEAIHPDFLLELRQLIAA